MNNLVFRKITKDVQKKILSIASKNKWLLWFYDLHQKEVIKSAERLLKIYKKADKKTVILACWLHDIAHYYARNSEEVAKIKPAHHITSAEIAGKFLKKYNIIPKEIEKIKNCIKRHRNSSPHIPKTLEEKIVAVADTLSHFESVFYFIYFKICPNHSLEKMVENDLAKLARDWRDLGLLPKSRKLVKKKYDVLKDLFNSYGK